MCCEKDKSQYQGHHYVNHKGRGYGRLMLFTFVLMQPCLDQLVAGKLKPFGSSGNALY